MPYAITCRSCGSRFSVADDLFRRKFAGKLVTVQCRHCRASIRLDASELPTSPSNPLPDPPTLRSNERPTPPDPFEAVEAPVPPPESSRRLTARGASTPEAPPAAALEDAHAATQAAPVTAVSATAEPIAPAPRRGPPRPPRPGDGPGRFVALGPGLLGGSDGAAGLGDVFRGDLAHASTAPTAATTAPVATTAPAAPKLPAASALAASAPATDELAPDEFPVDLSDAALSVPPSADAGEDEVTVAEPRAAFLAEAAEAEEDVEFLLGLRKEPSKAQPIFLSPADDEALLLAPPASADIPTPRMVRTEAAERRHAPAASAPLVAPLGDPGAQQGQRRTRTLVLAAFGAIVFGVLAALVHRTASSDALADASAAATSAHAATPPAASAIDSAASPAPEAASSASSAPAPGEAASTEKPLDIDRAAELAPRAAAVVRRASESRTLAAPEKPAPPSKAETPSTPPATPAPVSPPANDASAPFDRTSAAAALASAAQRASSCRKEGDPSGTATIVVTFAPSGRVTSARLNGPPFAATATGSCIASSMRSAKVPPFAGESVTVSKTVVIQ